jgi:hypothetical protein
MILISSYNWNKIICNWKEEKKEDIRNKYLYNIFFEVDLLIKIKNYRKIIIFLKKLLKQKIKNKQKKIKNILLYYDMLKLLLKLLLNDI